MNGWVCDFEPLLLRKAKKETRLSKIQKTHQLRATRYCTPMISTSPITDLAAFPYQPVDMLLIFVFLFRSFAA